MPAAMHGSRLCCGALSTAACLALTAALLLAYLQRLSGYSRAQITRLVSRWDAGKRLVKNYGAARQPFARLYTPADVALLVDVDRAMGTLSGPATACVLRTAPPA